MKRAPMSDLKFQDAKPVNPSKGVWLFPSYGNLGVIETNQGLVIVDVPLNIFVKKVLQTLRSVLTAPIHTIFLTHGHADHAFSLNPVFESAEKSGHHPPRVIAQRNILDRFNRYRMLHDFNDHINRLQFAVPNEIPAFPLPDRNPDITFDRSLSIQVGGIDFHAYHAKGETDDHLWVWVPEKRAVLVGDMFIWSFPNIGNPLKVQRYTLEWAEGLESIVAKEPEILIPGHGPLLKGKTYIRDACLSVSSALRYLHEEVVKRLNAGMGYEDILHDIRVPEEWSENDFLKPVYGCPSFVIHGILRQYMGWYDGNPSNLFPPKKSDILKEIAKLVGIQRLMERFNVLRKEGNVQMALQIIDIALAAENLDPEKEAEMHGLKAELLGALGDEEPSFIARNIYYAGHNRERELADTTPENG